MKTQYLVTVEHKGKCPDDMGEILADRAHMYLHAKGGSGSATATLIPDGPSMVVLEVKEMRDEPK